MENRSVKVLAIDDNPDNLIILKALICEAFPDAHVATALDGETGIKIAAEDDPDVIFLDVVMPGMDGFEVCRRLKAEKYLKDIPVIFITALKGDKESRIKALECGAEGFLAKPIDETELTAQIRAMKRVKEASNLKRDEKARLTKLVQEKTYELNQAQMKTLNLLEELKIENEARKESEQRYRSIFHCAGLGICIVALDGTYLHLNKAFSKIVGYSEDELKKMSYLELTYIEDVQKSKAMMEKLLKGEIDSASTEKRYVRKNGEVVTVILTANLIRNLEENPLYTVTTIHDISDRKKMEKELVYIGYHDQLTGVYNRRFFEEELKRIDAKRNLPIAIVMGDVNGLKLINDSLGHGVGDQLLKKVAETIKKQCRADDIMARVGGDEFVMIFPKTDAKEVSEIIARIYKAAEKEKIANIDLSVSFGFNIKTLETQSISDVLANAENDMYKHKIYERASVKSKVVDIIMNTLFAKSSRESLHSQRVSRLASLIAANMGFEKEDVNRIRVAGLVHDIGKISVDEQILNKVDPLILGEWEELKKHPEVGWRILNSTEEFIDVSEYVLSHHERWDGTGYPNGLKGEEIPIEARIISVADAYDAMTSKRSYRQELEKNEAMEEILKCSASQFDPFVVDVLVNQILKVEVKRSNLMGGFSSYEQTTI